MTPVPNPDLSRRGCRHVISWAGNGTEMHPPPGFYPCSNCGSQIVVREGGATEQYQASWSHLRIGSLEADLHRLMGAAQNVWAWVGPGYPDLDDEDERERFMRDVSKLAAVYCSLRRRSVASDETLHTSEEER